MSTKLFVFVALATFGTANEQRTDLTRAVIRGIKAHNPKTREASILRLTEERQINPDLIVPALSARLRDQYPAVQLAAASALGIFGEMVRDIDPSAEDGLDDLLIHGNSQVRRNAADALGNIGFHGSRTVTLLLDTLRNKKAGQLRLAAAGALVKLAGDAKQASGDLMRIVADPSESPTLRHKCADALAGMGTVAAGAVDALLQALNSPDEEVQEGAAWGLGNIGIDAARAVEPLKSRLLVAREPKTLRVIAWALGEMGGAARTAIDDLLTTTELNAADARFLKVREAAAQSLENIAGALLAAKQTGSIGELISVRDRLLRNADLSVKQRGQVVGDTIRYLVLVQNDAQRAAWMQRAWQSWYYIALPVFLLLIFLTWRILLKLCPDRVLCIAENLDRRLDKNDAHRMGGMKRPVNACNSLAHLSPQRSEYLGIQTQPLNGIAVHKSRTIRRITCSDEP